MSFEQYSRLVHHIVRYCASTYNTVPHSTGTVPYGTALRTRGGFLELTEWIAQGSSLGRCRACPLFHRATGGESADKSPPPSSLRRGFPLVPAPNVCTKG